MLIIHSNGQTEPLQYYKELQIKTRVNGERSLSFLLLSTDENYNLVETDNIIEYAGQKYRIIKSNERSKGESSVKYIQCLHILFDLIENDVATVLNGSQTLNQVMSFILNGTTYTFDIVDSFGTVNFEDWGEDNSLALFQKALNLFNAEFEVNNTHITLKAQIGDTTDFQFRYRHNIKTIEKNVEKSGSEVKLSIKLTFAELKKAGYNFEVCGVGDTVYTIYEPMGINLTNRIIEYVEFPLEPKESTVILSNYENNITDIMADFGQTQKRFNKVVDSNDKIKFNVLDDATQRATTALNNALTELEFPENLGIIARDPNDANRFVVLRSNGIGITTDGGKTFKDAITADGFVLSAGAIGQLSANNIKIGATTDFDTGYDPSEKETPTGAQSKADSAETAAKGHADTVASTAESNAKTYADGKVDPYKTTWDKADIINKNSKFEWTENGFVAIDPSNSNIRVKLTSGGLGISEDGGATYRTAITGLGIIADYVKSGTMLADRIKGGQLTLGGANNGNGLLRVVNENDEVVAELDAVNGGFEELYVGKLSSPSVQNVNYDNYNLYVDPLYGDDSKTGRNDFSNAKKTIQSAINSIPKTNHGAITIYVHYDNGREIRESEIDIYGFTGSGRVTLDFQTAMNELNGTVDIKGCTNFIHIRYGTINSNGNRYPINIERCAHVDIGSTIVSAHSTNTVGIMIRDGSSVYLSSVESYNATNEAIQVTMGARMSYWNCKGLGGSFGMYISRGALVSGHGTVPGGNAETYSVTYGGQLFTTPTADYGSAPNPTPPDTTETWTDIASKSWRDNWGWRTDNSDVYQGEWNGYGHHRGYWYFGTNISSKVTGKTIKKIRIYATRKSKGGTSLPVNAYFGWHGDASQPSGTPTIPSERVAVPFGWGDDDWFEAPTSWYDNFASGAAKGVGIYTTSTSNDNYMIFEPILKIEITYA